MTTVKIYRKDLQPIIGFESISAFVLGAFDEVAPFECIEEEWDGEALVGFRTITLGGQL